jgi:hypothetical protein
MRINTDFCKRIGITINEYIEFAASLTNIPESGILLYMMLFRAVVTRFFHIKIDNFDCFAVRMKRLLARMRNGNCPLRTVQKW